MNKFLLQASVTSITVMTLCGCVKPQTKKTQDPFEGFNRKMFLINSVVDRVTLYPAAVIYKKITTPPIRQIISNFFNNLSVPLTFTNDLLQGKFHYAAQDVGRFIFNSTVGIGGLVDVASKMNIAKHKNDFGNTLAYYSKRKQSAFLMLPLFGPSTLRDAFAIPFNILSDPVTYVKKNATLNNSLRVTALVSARTKLLSRDKILVKSADPYLLVRQSYLQQRQKAVQINDESGDYRFGQHYDADSKPSANLDKKKPQNSRLPSPHNQETQH